MMTPKCSSKHTKPEATNQTEASEITLMQKPFASNSIESEQLGGGGSRLLVK